MPNSDNTNMHCQKAIHSAIRLEKHSKKNILSVMRRFGESTIPIDIDSTENVKKFFEDLNEALSLCNQNIDILNNLAKNLDDITILDNTQNEQIEDIDIASSLKSYNIEYKERTLIISEISGCVLLPYSVSELKEELKRYPDKYSSVGDIINKKYTLPISLFKNPFVARFRESFKLMRAKEKSSIKEAFDLGMELMFNYNLHPAIISSCKNLDELDIYLDYLDNGETEKFDIFKIVFEIAPTVVKAKHKF